jgi:hypothetical protein
VQLCRSPPERINPDGGDLKRTADTKTDKKKKPSTRLPAVDDVEHVLHPSLPEGEVDGLPKGFSKAEFNVLARAYLEEHATEEHIVTARELAEYVGSKNPAGTCSTSTVSKLLCWRAYRDEMERTGRKGKKARPRAVSLTPALEASVGKPDACLEKLMQEQKDDAELSPLEDDLPDEPRVKFQPKIRRKV